MPANKLILGQEGDGEGQGSELRFESVGFEVVKADKLKGGGVRCFEVDRRSNAAPQRITPARYANTPAISGIESRKSPLRMGRNEIVPVEHREIEKIASHDNANGVQTDVLRTGVAEPVAIKSCYGIAATAFEFGAENVRWHRAR